MKRIVCSTVLCETSPQALPLGAACIASALKSDRLTKKSFETDLVVLSREDSEYKAAANKASFIAEKICASGTVHYVLLSIFVWNTSELSKVAATLRKQFPNIVLIAGGPEVTASPLSFSQFDFAVCGTGELAVPKLIAELERTHFAQNRDKNQVQLPQGIYAQTKQNDQCTQNAISTSGTAAPASTTQQHIQRTVAAAPEQLSSPYLDGTLDPAQYGGALWELARGCPFKCSYCYESKGEKHIQYFPIERITAELELFNKKKIPQVFVLDPTYNANKKRALELLRLIEQKAPGMFFYFEARAEFIDRELARAFTKIPCALQFGLQSANPDVLKKVNRTFDKKLFVRNIGYLNESGAVFGFDLIYGLPGDTLNGFMQSMDFALNLYPNNLETFCLSVLPGTDLAEQAQSLGLTYQKKPPYHVLHTAQISEQDMARAAKLSAACTVLYNQGRAVPWFCTVCRALKMRPALFIEQFALWYQKTILPKTKKPLTAFAAECAPHTTVESLQIQFINYIFAQRTKTKLISAAESLIRFNGALSRLESDGKEQTVRLLYHPDDLASPYATDLTFFAQNARRYPCTVHIYRAKNGEPRWKCV